MDGRYERGRLALVMVGLPARGKTHIARRLARYLRWQGLRAKVFNVGNYRRERLGSRQSHEFFDPKNETGRQARRALAEAALEDFLAFFAGGGQVGVYDATNTTKERRAWLAKRMRAHQLEVIFVESVSTDESLIDANVRQTKLHMPDYAGMSSDDAVADFRRRMAHYESTYNEVEEDEGSFVRIIDVGRKLVAHRMRGGLASRLVPFLLNLHIVPRPIWITRHGQSEFNALGKIGGNSGLTETGRAYAKNLAEYLEGRGLMSPEAGLRVWTSTLVRTRQTAAPLGMRTEAWRALDEIDAGECEGMTYKEIREEQPREWENRRRDKLNYRYVGGESYVDLIRRLEPVILELEREQRPILIVAHQAVLRALYAYLMDRPAAEVPYLPLPLHTLIELQPSTYGCAETQVQLGPAPS